MSPGAHEYTVKLCNLTQSFYLVYPNLTELNSSIHSQGLYGGVLYTRWGKSTCPTGAELVYDGIMGGTHYSKRAGGGNYLCFAKDPQYNSKESPKAYSELHGSEYQTYDRGIFSGKHNHDAPCAVCYRPEKKVELMIPARTACFSSWHKEYSGYLMTEHKEHRRNAYVCIDGSPDSVPGSRGDKNGAQLYFVGTSCNGLPCGSKSYVEKRPLTCVVCTK